MKLELPYSVDLISDLHLTTIENFEWDNKASSLFCIVAGNISKDIRLTAEALEIIAKHYRGVFFIDGALEHSNKNYKDIVMYFKNFTKKIDNISYLHNHVVILDNVAFVGANGWYGNSVRDHTPYEQHEIDSMCVEDSNYLTRTIKTLQSHEGTKRIVIVTNSIPSTHLTLGKKIPGTINHIGPAVSLLSDQENKVRAWLFGSYQQIVDDEYNNRRYVNNPKIENLPYYPKRVIIPEN